MKKTKQKTPHQNQQQNTGIPTKTRNTLPQYALAFRGNIFYFRMFRWSIKNFTVLKKPEGTVQKWKIWLI